ncbi:hypothetical protein [Methylobacterium sp. WL64]|uniref:hypothetical protein n=1 Tax=Methylobacterium sp. WL64 TaxID=2603894 RepID=UPI00164F53B0|nr:hypothetical protein [Methylobacterium sp. WL64]
MLHTLAPIFIALATVLGCPLLAGRDHRHGREVIVIAVLCLTCATLGVIGEMA